MNVSRTTVNLTLGMFAGGESLIVQDGVLSAHAFRYSSGAYAVRLRNDLGQLILLPFQGQQIWSAEFLERNLTMKSMFTEPRPTRIYLENYGGFLLHCGATAMGVPTRNDTHPLHGELPNAPYTKAYLVAGEDQKGRYLGLGGEYQHTVAFSANYVAAPLVKLYAGSSLFSVSLTITNLRKKPMELMYLAHINFRPADNGRLVYTAECTPEHVRVRGSLPSHIRPEPGFVESIEAFRRDPARHHLLTPSLKFDPEVVFVIDYSADADGWAHSLQIHPDGGADYVRHRPSELDKGVRWICRTGDEDALGLVLPATAEPEGYLAEKAKGNIRILPALDKFHFELELGALSPAAVSQLTHKLSPILTGL